MKKLYITNDTSKLTIYFETVYAAEGVTIIASDDKNAARQATPFKFYEGVEWSKTDAIKLDNLDEKLHVEMMYNEMVNRHKVRVNHAYLAYYIHETFKALAEIERGKMMDGHFKNRIARKFKELSGLESAKVELESGSMSLDMRFSCGGSNELITLAGWQSSYYFDFEKITKGSSSNGSEYWADVRIGQVIPLNSKADVRKRVRAFIKASRAFVEAFEGVQDISGMEYAHKLDNVQYGSRNQFVHLNNSIERVML